MSQSDRTFFYLPNLWPILLALTAVAAVGVRTVTQPSVWMHLSMGRWIHQHGIPRIDPFHMTDKETPWMDFTWLYDLVVFSVHRLGGMPGVTLLHLAAVFVAFLLLALVAREVASSVSVALAILLSVWILAPTLAPTPATLTLVFPAAYLFILRRPTCSAMAIIILAALQVVWINLSPSGVIGPILCLLFLVGATCRKRQEPSASRKPVTFGVATLVTALACTGNPYGLSAVEAGFADLLGFQSQMAPFWISNYAAMASHSLPRHLTTAALAVGAGGLLTYRGRLPLGTTLVAILGLLCCFSPGHLAFFSVLICPFMALSLSGVAMELTRNYQTARALLHITAPATVILITGFTWFIMITNVYASWSGRASRFGLGSDTALVPSQAVAALSAFGESTRILHHPHDAGYMLWNRPDQKVAIDARAGFYRTETMQQFLGAFSGRGGDVEACLEQVQPDIVLINLTWPGSGYFLRSLLETGFFIQAYIDGTAVVLLSITSSSPRLSDFPVERGLQALETHRQTVREALEAGRFPSHISTMVGAGELFFYLQQWKHAAAAYELVCNTYPTMGEAWFRLGYANLELERPQQAAAALARAVDLSPKNSRIINAAAEAYDLLGQPEEAGRLRTWASDP